MVRKTSTAEYESACDQEGSIDRKFVCPFEGLAQVGELVGEELDIFARFRGKLEFIMIRSMMSMRTKGPIMLVGSSSGMNFWISERRVGPIVLSMKMPEVMRFRLSQESPFARRMSI